MIDILKNGFERLNIPYSDKQLAQLTEYASLLKEWNEKINLTSITEDSEIAVKHFIDSASALTTGKVCGRVIDVGTGAGFPGLVLKIMQPDIKLTLLDSLNKRLTFLKEVTGRLGINDVEFIHSRAEDGGHKAELRESFDTVVSRAVAAMPLLSELCLPYVKKNGYFLALKGPAAEDEVLSAKRAVSILGGETEGISDVEVDGADHKIVIVKKVRHTPIKFPRKPALISKAPIETCYKMPKRPSL